MRPLLCCADHTPAAPSSWGSERWLPGATWRFPDAVTGTHRGSPPFLGLCVQQGCVYVCISLREGEEDGRRPHSLRESMAFGKESGQKACKGAGTTLTQKRSGCCSGERQDAHQMRAGKEGGEENKLWTNESIPVFS